MVEVRKAEEVLADALKTTDGPVEQMLSFYRADAVLHAIRQAQREAIEAAAKVAETHVHPHGPALTANRFRRDIAAAIRSLGGDA